MKAMRLMAAVVAKAELDVQLLAARDCRGLMISRKGRAIPAAAPRKTERRDIPSRRNTDGAFPADDRAFSFCLDDGMIGPGFLIE